MNPITDDFRDTVRQGEKTGSPFQSDRDFRQRRRSAATAASWIVPVAALVVAVLGAAFIAGFFA